MTGMGTVVRNTVAAIASFLLESVSYFDAAAEGFLHGLTLGFLAVLRKRFRVLSNVESGEGRFDIALSRLSPGSRRSSSR